MRSWRLERALGVVGGKFTKTLKPPRLPGRCEGAGGHNGGGGGVLQGQDVSTRGAPVCCARQGAHSVRAPAPGQKVLGSYPRSIAGARVQRTACRQVRGAIGAGSRWLPSRSGTEGTAGKTRRCTRGRGHHRRTWHAWGGRPDCFP